MPHPFRRDVSRAWPLVVAAFACLGVARADDAETPPRWIWHPGDTPNAVAIETRYFRKTFVVATPARLRIDVTADNEVILYLDGRKIAENASWESAESVETKLVPGTHALAAVARNREPGPAGLLVRGEIRPGGTIHSDSSWKTIAARPQGDAWLQPGFDDGHWLKAADLGAFGVAPWGRGVAFSSGDGSGRFQVAEGFKVERVAAPSVTGSVVAFTFDEKSQPCVSIERQSIARLIDVDGDGRFDERRVIAPQMTNCQGLSFIRGKLYAIGDGLKGCGLYRLADSNDDGVFDQADLLRGAEGGMGEHGPHAVVAGPDGKLYMNVGNHAHLRGPIRPHGPVDALYEGELLGHYNDPRGHAAGINAPGGEIYRSDDEGATWTRISSGYRNAYDFAFNRAGEIFTVDSDMEWDVGLPWYRPVRINHAIIGSEFGWRNGSAKWPESFPDSLPATLDLGRGSPTGLTFYHGLAFPKGYDDNLLVCDWSQGRILAVALTKAGASYTAKATVLISGQPLNATDIEVGPDGSVYFSTGGRGTQGGLFRISPNESRRTPAPKLVPLPVLLLQLQTPSSSATRAAIAEIRRTAGAEWNEVAKFVESDRGPGESWRARLLDILAEVGPEPTDDWLARLARDNDADLRARAIALLGQRPTRIAQAALSAALDDPDPFVRRRACEGLTQQPKAAIPVDRLIPLLDDPDRFLRFAARTAIEHGDVAPARKALIPGPTNRAAIEGMLAILRGLPIDGERQDDVMGRAWEQLVRGKTLPPDELRDVLRVVSLNYQLGPRKADHPASPHLRALLVSAFPTGDRDNDRELARVLAYLNEPKAVEAILEHMASGIDRPSRIHDAYCLRAIEAGWNARAKEEFWHWFENASRWDGGFSYLGYLDFMIGDFLPRLTNEDRSIALAKGEQAPFPTRILVRSLDLDRDRDREPGRIAELASLFERLGGAENAATAKELRGLILETLGRSTHPESRAALRDLARRDPSRRDAIARIVAARPTPSDLPTLADALDSGDPNTAGAVVAALKRLSVAPEGPDPLRRLIQLARRTGQPTSPDLDTLAARWTRSAGSPRRDDLATTLTHWETYYARTYPGAPPIRSDAPAAQNHYSLSQLGTNVLDNPERIRSASPERGREVLARARCLACHKLGDQGAGLGPDLTTLRSRFSNLEILESIVVPSKVVSDQYRAKTIATTDGKVINGMPVGDEPANLILLLADGSRVTIKKSEIDQNSDSTTSIMPAGLLDALTYQDVADLIAAFNATPRVEAPAPRK